MQNKMNESSDNVIAVDLALLPAAKDLQLFDQMNSFVFETWNRGFRFSNNRIPHLTLFQGYMKSSQINSLIETDLNNRPLPCEDFGLNNFCLSIGDFEFQPYHNDIYIQMLNFHCGPSLKRTQADLMNLLHPYQDVLSPAQYLVKNAFVDDSLIEEARHWVANYVTTRSQKGFSPHVTIGFGREEAFNRLIEFRKHKNLSRIRFDRIALAQMGDFCTLSNRIFWEKSLLICSSQLQYYRK